MLWVLVGTREAAFVHAITSAGVVYAVTRACSSGQLHRCGCDRSITTRSPPPTNVSYASLWKCSLVARKRVCLPAIASGHPRVRFGDLGV